MEIVTNLLALLIYFHFLNSSMNVRFNFSKLSQSSSCMSKACHSLRLSIMRRPMRNEFSLKEVFGESILQKTSNIIYQMFLHNIVFCYISLQS